MYTVITGAAGFIGSNLVKALNARGETRILAVDDLTEGDKFRNLVDCEIADYLDKDEFLVRLSDGDFDDEIAAVLHQGACSDTMATDGRSMLANNYRYSVRLLEHCQDNDVPFLYASSAAVYGAGTAFREERACEAPLNVYAYSKFLFDQYVRGMLPERTAQVAGFRYFNVYGPREAHKGRMASVVWHFFNQYRASGKVRLFEGSGGYGAGEQRRDFVSVEDVVKVNLHFLGHPERSMRWPRQPSMPAALPIGNRRCPSPTCTAMARSSMSVSRRRSPASTKASPRPICRGCGLRATAHRCSRSRKASRAACARCLPAPQAALNIVAPRPACRERPRGDSTN